MGNKHHTSFGISSRLDARKFQNRCIHDAAWRKYESKTTGERLEVLVAYPTDSLDARSWKSKEYYPAYTLDEIMEVLPPFLTVDGLDYRLDMCRAMIGMPPHEEYDWCVMYEGMAFMQPALHSERDKRAVEAAARLAEWAIDNGHFKI